MTEPPPEKDESDHRAETRRRVLFSGKLVYGFPEMSLDCAIADISRTGARVRLPGPEPLIDPIYLIEVRHGLAFRAREVWRRESLVGLSFTNTFNLNNPNQELPPIVRQLWLAQVR
ncbi:MAG: PilZ domain-containing protein [Caulobacterales bacterium]